MLLFWSHDLLIPPGCPANTQGPLVPPHGVDGMRCLQHDLISEPVLLLLVVVAGGWDYFLEQPRCLRLVVLLVAVVQGLVVLRELCKLTPCEFLRWPGFNRQTPDP